MGFSSPAWCGTGAAEPIGTGSSDCLSHSCRLKFGDPRDIPIDDADVGYIEQLGKGVAQRHEARTCLD